MSAPEEGEGRPFQLTATFVPAVAREAAVRAGQPSGRCAVGASRQEETKKTKWWGYKSSRVVRWANITSEKERDATDGSSTSLPLSATGAVLPVDTRYVNHPT